MKKVLLIIITALAFTACSTLTDIPSYTETIVIDLTQYSNEGFLITPEPYLGEYSSVGMVDISLFPRAKKLSYDRITNDIKEQYNVQGVWAVDKIETKDVVDIVYEKAKAMGADAVINFKISYIYKSYPEFTHNGLRVTGFAIKRN